MDKLRSEASVIHRQLTPVWRRKVNQSRLLLLDTPLGDGLTLYDLVCGQATVDPGLEAGFEDPRLTEILKDLSPAEQAVTLALGARGVTTWAEAAMAAGAADPERQGEKVRRKVRRLARRITGSSPRGRSEHGERPMNAPAPVAARPARREVVLRIALPRIPACTAVLGTGSVSAALLHGTVPAASPLVWPLVVLALGAMAYDVGLRALPAATADHAAARHRGPSRATLCSAGSCLC